MDMWSYSDLQDSATGFFETVKLCDIQGVGCEWYQLSTPKGSNCAYLCSKTWTIRIIKPPVLKNLKSCARFTFNNKNINKKLFQHFPTMKNWLGSTNTSQHEGLAFFLLMLQKSIILTVLFMKPCEKWVKNLPTNLNWSVNWTRISGETINCFLPHLGWVVVGPSSGWPARRPRMEKKISEKNTWGQQKSQWNHGKKTWFMLKSIIYLYESGEGFCPTILFWYLPLPLSQRGFFYFDVSPKSNTFKNHDEKNTPCHSCIESYLGTMVPKGSKVLHKRWFFGVLVYHPT